MREIVLDTETTGLDPKSGDRVVEIGCVELIDHLPTGKEYHQYINPQRDMPESAFKVHGLSAEFLSDFKIFKEIAGKFLEFIGDDPLVIHNAEFDLKFLNAELQTCGHDVLVSSRAIDTLTLARRKFPGAQASLDALCRRFEIDNSNRTKHGALLDSQILSEVYLELIGGRQRGLELSDKSKDGGGQAIAGTTESLVLQNAPAGASLNGGSAKTLPSPCSPRPPRPHNPSQEEESRHREMLSLLKDPLWTK